MAVPQVTLHLKASNHGQESLHAWGAANQVVVEAVNLEDEDMAVLNLCCKAQKLTSGPSLSKILSKKRKEATATDKRNYAQ